MSHSDRFKVKQPITVKQLKKTLDLISDDALVFVEIDGSAEFCAGVENMENANKVLLIRTTYRNSPS